MVFEQLIWKLGKMACSAVDDQNSPLGVLIIYGGGVLTPEVLRDGFRRGCAKWVWLSGFIEFCTWVYFCSPLGAQRKSHVSLELRVIIVLRAK